MKRKCLFYCGPWGEWQYVSNGSCEQRRKCLSCIEGYSEPRIEHKWGALKPYYKNKIIQATICLRKIVNTFSDSFSNNVLREICAKMDIPYGDIVIDGNVKSSLIKLLIIAQTRNSLHDLMSELFICTNHAVDTSRIDISILNKIVISNLSFSIEENATCAYTRVCNRCGKREYKNKHKFETRKKECSIYQICPICGYGKVVEERHNWSDWEYISDDSCRKRRVCIDCPHEEIQKDADIEHIWSEWQYNYANKCGMSRHCLRCGKKEYKDSHTWMQLRTSKGVEYRHCSRCNSSTIDKLPEESIWQGYIIWNNGAKDLWSLKLRPNNSYFAFHNVIGELNVKFIHNNAQCEVIQKIKGDLDLQTGKLSFKGKVIYNPYNATYQADSFDGYIQESYSIVIGIAEDEFNKGQVLLR